jgi:O-antigen ligase
VSSSINGARIVSHVGGVGRNTIDKLSFGVLWVLAFSIPAGEQLSLPGLGAATRLVGICAFGIGLLAIVMAGQIRRLHEAHYFMAAFVLWACVSYYWSIAPEVTAERTITYLQIASMVWLIWQLAWNEGRVYALLNAYVLGTNLCATVVFANYLSGRTSALIQMTNEATTEAARYTVSGLNENDLGIMLALSIPMAWRLSLRQKNWVVELFYWLHIAWVAAAIVLTASRTSVIAAGIAILLVPLTFRRIDGKAILLLLGTGTFGLIALCFVPQASWQRIFTIKSELSEGTMSKRTLIWRAALDAYPERPLQGFGAGAAAQRIAGTLDVPFAIHNTFLSVLFELGLIGATLFSLLLLAICLSFVPAFDADCIFWLVILVSWITGVSASSWEYKKTTWFLFAIATAHAALMRTRQWPVLPAATCQH